MLNFCILALTQTLLLAAAIWIWIVIIKLFTDKEYRKYPPYVPSFGAERKNIIEKTENILKNRASETTVLDPGCGTGGLILKLAKEFPQHRFVGIEWNKFAAFVCRLKAKKYKNVEIICDDMFNHDFGHADIIVCFLIEPLMKRFTEKVLKDNKKPQTVISNTFELPDIELYRKIDGKGIFFKNVYIYKIG